MKHFPTEDAALQYIRDELLATLRDDLERMEGRESQHYEDSDRAEMRDRISDLESVIPRLMIVPDDLTPGALYTAGYNAEQAGVDSWQNPHRSGSVAAYEWDAGHTGAHRLRKALPGLIK